MTLNNARLAPEVLLAQVGQHQLTVELSCASNTTIVNWEALRLEIMPVQLVHMLLIQEPCLFLIVYHVLPVRIA